MPALSADSVEYDEPQRTIMGIYEKIVQALQQQQKIPQKPPEQAPIGAGAAELAKQKLLAQEAYKQYVIDAQTNGQQPAPFDAWFQSQGK